MLNTLLHTKSRLGLLLEHAKGEGELSSLGCNFSIGIPGCLHFLCDTKGRMRQHKAQASTLSRTNEYLPVPAFEKMVVE